MRVALAYRSFELTGSLPRFSVELARYLSRSHDVHVFSIGPRTDPTLAPGCTFHDVPVSALGPPGSFSARELGSFALSAAKLLRNGSFDVVHVRAPSTWVGQVLHLPGIARGEAALQGMAPWRYRASTVRHPGNAVRRVIEHRAIGNPELRRIHVDAPSVRDDLIRFYGIDPADVVVATPGVNLAEFRPTPDRAAVRARLGVAHSAFVVAFCGHDFHRKGLDRAIEAVAGARSKPVLVVAGNCPDAGSFISLAASRGVRERVCFLGATSETQLVYQAADLYVLPTRADVWGTTVIEAMACGTPPVVTAAAGAAQAVETGLTGVVLPEPFEAETLRDVIDELAGDSDRRAAMGRLAVAAAQEHSWDSHGRLVEEDLAVVAAGQLPPVRRVR